jgi:hypothetical protein
MNSDKRATTRGLSPDEFDKMAERAKKNKVLQERLNNRNMICTCMGLIATF